MLCPRCNTELAIAAVTQRVSGDTSPDTPTVVTNVQTLRCRNPQCENYKKAVAESVTELYSSEDNAKDALL